MSLSPEATRTVMLDWSEHGAMLLHRPTGRIGKAGKYYEPGEYMGSPGGKPVTAPVLKVGDHALIATRATLFQELSTAEAAYYNDFVLMLGTTLSRAIRVSALQQIPPERAVMLMVAALSDQLRLLDVPATA